MRAVVLLLVALPCAVLAQSAKGQSSAPSGQGLVVRVAQGQLRGVRIERGPNATVSAFFAFRGVPFARPPVGRLRFKDPEEPGSWTGVRDATDFSPACIQKSLDNGNVSGEEDCLYLNVHTVDPPELWSRVKRPVMIYFHGGAFVSGTGSGDVVRPDPLLREGIIFVTMNYRLGVMGFLNTGNSQAPGNAAMKDQVMALRWLQKNIAVFGGDPNQVTIAGESAGGAFVNFHMLSPLSKGLFHRAISVSGNALIPSARVPDPARRAQALRQRFSAACPDIDPNDVVSCLQKVDAQELVFNQYDVPLEQFQNYFLTNIFPPSVEAPGSSSAPFLSAPPGKLMTDGRFTRVPYMTGFTTGEGILTLVLAGVLQDPSRWIAIDENFTDIFLWDMPVGLQTRAAVEQVRNFYLGNSSLRDAHQNLDTLQRFVQLCTDMGTAVPAINSARLMADQGANIYMYQFSRDGPIAFIKNLAYNLSYVPGVAHGDDMAYVFDFTDGMDNLLPVPASEQPLRERQIKIFANMVKTGNPTPEGSGLLHWPQFSAPDESYMDMGLQLRVHQHALGERIAFWRRLADSQKQTLPPGRKTRS